MNNQDILKSLKQKQMTQSKSNSSSSASLLSKIPFIGFFV